MVCTTQAVVRPGPEAVVLTVAHRSSMLALTSLVFPGFFRARTVEMGRYRDNARALSLYEYLGYRLRREVQLLSVTREWPL